MKGTIECTWIHRPFIIVPHEFQPRQRWFVTTLVNRISSPSCRKEDYHSSMYHWWRNIHLRHFLKCLEIIGLPWVSHILYFPSCILWAHVPTTWIVPKSPHRAREKNGNDRYWSFWCPYRLEYPIGSQLNVHHEGSGILSLSQHDVSL